jgi:hypothetical protein
MISGTEKNTNCLEGVKCPNCLSDGPFRIAARIMVTVYDNGTEDEGGDYEWDGDTFCECCECRHAAKVKDFRGEYEQAKPQ